VQDIKDGGGGEGGKEACLEDEWGGVGFGFGFGFGTGEEEQDDT
jgi:hypothetical protein